MACRERSAARNRSWAIEDDIGAENDQNRLKGDTREPQMAANNAVNATQ